MASPGLGGSAFGGSGAQHALRGVLGIVYNYLPLMVLPLFVSLDRLDRSLLEGSRDLGAGPSPRFRQITLPLSLPGIISGCLLVFIPAMGEYLIPVLLGGGKTYFLGNALADLFLQSRNWPFGSALGTAFVADDGGRRAAISRCRAARPEPPGVQLL